MNLMCVAPGKASYIEARIWIKISTLSPTNPQRLTFNSCLNLGLVIGEVVTPNVSKQSKERNEEKRHQPHGVDNLCGEP